MTKDKQYWVRTGYDICSFEGIDRLKVEYVAKKVGVSKSSFYHHFGDIAGFLDALIEYHYERCVLLASKEKECTKIHPDLIVILLEHKVDLLFHRQLRVNRDNREIQEALSKSQQLLGNYAVMLWAKSLNVDLSTFQLEALFEIATDDFYMQITKDNLNYEFLSSYFKNLSRVSRLLNHRCTPPSKKL